MRLLHVVAGTYTPMQEMYDWLAEQVQEVHAEEIQDVNRLISLTHEMLDHGPPPAPRT